jgi:hypothetical protein
MDNILIKKPSIPSFHYSMIEAKKRRPQKYAISSLGYRNSETYYPSGGKAHAEAKR